ncbi:hypothetical protein HOD38_00135 [archaeon]|jgi:hypothetical protein|nr:hypothetical protein [archaeon]MBT4396654.1 hypothetical protein [archaeon]MBT4441264.1 hypothetical protein [archaeon]
MKKAILILILLLVSVSACTELSEINVDTNDADPNLEVVEVEEEPKIVCGDGKCDKTESHNSCSQDCEWEDISDLALDIDNLPEGFEVVTRGPRDKTDVSAESINSGWEGGYYASFVKEGMTTLEQYISIYPKETISQTLDTSKGLLATGEVLDEEENSKYTYTQLSNPNLGDESILFKMTRENYDWDNKISYYVLEFYKDNVYMAFYTTDYELLKGIGEIAEKKI